MYWPLSKKKLLTVTVLEEITHFTVQNPESKHSTNFKVHEKVSPKQNVSVTTMIIAFSGMI